MIGPAVTHLVESTVFATLAALLLRALRVRKPSVRHGAWLLAAIKFALPAFLFTGLGGNIRALMLQLTPAMQLYERCGWIPVGDVTVQLGGDFTLEERVYRGPEQPTESR